tara:strand:- start:583 stop:1125 length:543 start_codon:yes stop_codon:yes gene_type:complete
MSSAQDEAMKEIAIVMGSDSDLKTLAPAIEILEEFDIAVLVRILSAHRTPLEMIDFATKAEAKGIKVIVAGAGGAAHLPGMIASLTNIPVIGVPVQSKALSGVDSMHSILQMPSGIPVATVAIGGGLNAGLLAAQILATSNPLLKQKISNYRNNLHDLIVEKDNKLTSLGTKEYLLKMQR